MSWAAVVTTVGGALLGSQGNETSSTQQQRRHPRIDAAWFGEDGQGGLLGQVTDRFNANPSGINQQMLEGWNSQYNTATNPSIRAGYENMRQNGNAHMSLPIAGNPFTQPGGYSRDMFGGGPQGGAMPQVRTAVPYQPGAQGPEPQSYTPAPAPAPRQPAAQTGPAPGYNPSTQTPSDIAGLYAEIGRTGSNAPGADEVAYWRNKGLQGDALRQRFLQEASAYGRGRGYDSNIDRAQGLLGAGPRPPAFSMPATPARSVAAAPAGPTQQELSEQEKLLRLMNVGTY